jgi:hypothetical protein
MPYTKEELKTYQYHLNRAENQRQKYQDYLDDQNISQTSERNHLVASGSDVLISFEDIDEGRRKQSPFGRIGLSRDDHKVFKTNVYPEFYKGEKSETTIDTDIDSLIIKAPALRSVRLHNAPNNNILKPLLTGELDETGTSFRPSLLTPSRETPKVRTDGYTIDLINGDIIGSPEALDGEEPELGLEIYYLENNRRRRFPNYDILFSYVGTLLSSNIELEVLIIIKDDIDNILIGTPMEFNTI